MIPPASHTLLGMGFAARGTNTKAQSGRVGGGGCVEKSTPMMMTHHKNEKHETNPHR